eukprot:7097178-Heterocapsa_arctica.AAC.1
MVTLRPGDVELHGASCPSPSWGLRPQPMLLVMPALSFMVTLGPGDVEPKARPRTSLTRPRPPPP